MNMTPHAHPPRIPLLVSRSQDDVDGADDPDTLMAKLDLFLHHLPSWMKPKFTRTLLRLSGIAGEPRSPTVEDKLFEPRERPWYQAALRHTERSRWTPVDDLSFQPTASATR